MTYTQQRRMQAFERRKGIRHENITQAIVIAIIIFITPVIVSGFFSSRQELATNKATYYANYEQ